jgi:hypothetical protein
LIRLAAAFASSIRAAAGGEVEFFAVAHGEQGGAGELLFLEAVLELLKKRVVGSSIYCFFVQR